MRWNRVKEFQHYYDCYCMHTSIFVTLYGGKICLIVVQLLLSRLVCSLFFHKTFIYIIFPMCRVTHTSYSEKQIEKQGVRNPIVSSFHKNHLKCMSV